MIPKWMMLLLSVVLMAGCSQDTSDIRIGKRVPDDAVIIEQNENWVKYGVERRRVMEMPYVWIITVKNDTIVSVWRKY